MSQRYPRMIGEFAASRRVVLVYCGECQRKRAVPADVLEAMFGADFDLYLGFSALTAELRCEQCGKKHRLIIFRDQTEYPTGPVSFEDALNRELERRAYLAVRDVGLPQAVRKVRRRRR